MNKKIGFLFLVFILYAGVRLVPFFFTFTSTDRFFLADSYEYSLLGENIAQHGYYTQNGGEPGLRRTPGYPLYLALIYKIFGVKPAVALFFQIILSGFIPVFLYLNAEQLFSKRIAKIAAVISIFEPVSVIYVNILLSETLFVIFLLISTYFLIKSTKEERSAFVVLSAIFAGLSAYLRSISLYLPVFYALIYLLASRFSFRDRIKKSVSVIIIAALTVSPWIIRNYAVDQYKGFCSIQDINLYHWRAAGVISEVDHIPLRTAQENLDRAVPSGLSLANEYRFFRDKAARIIMHHPYAYFIVMLKGSINMLASPERYAVFKLANIKPRLLGFMWQGHSLENAINMLKSDPAIISAVVLYQAGFTVLLGLLILIGLVTAAGEGFYRELLFLVLIIAYFIIVSAGPEAEPRFRLPPLPYAIILVSTALSALSSSITRKHYKERIK